MHNDDLLQQWKSVLKSCNKIIDSSIKANILRIPTQKYTKQQFIHVYDLVYKLCSNPIGVESRVMMVYKDFKDLLRNGLIVMSKELLQQRDVYKLGMLRRICDAYQDALKRIKHMFALLDRPNILKQAKIDQLDRTGITIIVTTLFTEQALLQYDTIYFKQLAKIRKSRDMADANILKDYVQILYRFHMRLSKKQTKKARTLYTDFQQKYLTNARQHYTTLYHKLQQLSPSQYFLQVHELYLLEIRLSQQCFGTSSDSFINKIFAEQFLQEYRDKLVHSAKGLKYILQNREIQIITVITNLYKKLTNSIDGFKQPFQNFIYEQFTALMTDISVQLLVKKSQQIYISFIQRLIKKNSQLIQILQDSFMRFQQFIHYYRLGIQRAFFKNVLSIPIQQMLACYVDYKFKTAYPSQHQMKQDVMNIKGLFQCLENKDVFLMKYLQKLTRKIMTITPDGIENHQNLIHHLKIHSGNKITQNLQKVLSQYKFSRQNQKQFQISQQTSPHKPPYSLHLFLFSESVWPSSQDIIQFKQQQLSQIFKKGINCIRNYVKQKQQKNVIRLSFMDSRVRWMYYFQKQVQCKFQEAYFDTNGVQAVLLYYIYMQRPEKVNYSILCQIFPQIKPHIIKFSLSRMCQPHQCPILLLFTQQSQIYYQFNPLMKSRKRIIQYDLLSQQQDQQNQLFQRHQLTRQRQYAIDANVIKLMKSKKVLGFDKIIQEVIKMIRVFTPQTRDVKASVERLIQKEMLVREEKDKNTIKYKH